MTARCLYLVRHGESEWNAASRIQGQSPQAPGLTEVGHAQARSLARTLSSSGARRVISSDLLRAVETAATVADGLSIPLEVDARLRERSFGILEGQPVSSAGELETGIRSDRITDLSVRPPGGESVSNVRDRVSSLLTELLAPSSILPVVVVTHGGVIRTAVAHLGSGFEDGAVWSGVPNASILRIDQDEDAPTLSWIDNND